MTGPLPVVIVLLDGLADRPHDAFGGRTANEAAATPVLDALAARGRCGVHHALDPGRAPSSELAHWAMLGYRPDEFCGRAVLEARGHGLPVADDAVYAYGALRPSVVRDGARWLTGRAGAEQEPLCRVLLDRLAAIDPAVRVHPLPRGEAIVAFHGLDSDLVSDTDSFLEHRVPMLRPQPLEPAAVGAARVVETWTRAALDALAGEPLDTCTLKWFGRPRAVPPFRDRHGVEGPFAGASPFIAGLARTVALAPVRARDLVAGLAVAADALRGGASFAFCHTKAPDEAGHTKDPLVKRAVIEALDADLAVLAGPPFADAIVCVTGDHGTPACGSDIIHSGDAVPLIVTGPGVWADGLAFGERACRGGSLGVLRGADLTPVLLDLAGRAPFLGARVGPEPFSQCPWPV